MGLDDRNCNGCTICCEGYLEGESYGNFFKYPDSCVYLTNKICIIYDCRPDACRNYYCAWRQGLFSDSLFPPTSGFVVSVENLQNKQYLKIVGIRDEINIDEVKEFCSTNDTHYVIIKK